MYIFKKYTRFLCLILLLFLLLGTYTVSFAEWHGIIPDWWVFRFRQINAKEYNIISNGCIFPYNLHKNGYKKSSSAVDLRIRSNDEFIGIPDTNDIDSYKLTLTNADSFRYWTEEMYIGEDRHADPGKLILDGKTHDYFLPVCHHYRWTYDEGRKKDEIPVWFMLIIGRNESERTDPKELEDLWIPFVEAYKALMSLADDIEAQGEPKKSGDFHPSHSGYLKNAANEWSYLLQNSSAHLDPRLDFNDVGIPNPKKFDNSLKREQIQAAINTMYTHIDYVNTHKVNEPEILNFKVQNYHGIIDKLNHKVILKIPLGTKLDKDKVEIITPDWTVARYKSGELAVGKSAVYKVQALDALHEKYDVKPYKNVQQDWTVEVVEGKNISIINSLRYTNTDGKKVEANISDANIELNIPFGVNLTSLPLEIYHTGDEITYLNSNDEEIVFRNKDNIDVSSSVQIKVKLGNQQKIYTLKVNCTKATGNKITFFEIDGKSAEIDQEKGIITMIVPYGTDRTKMEPSIKVDYGATIEPKSHEVKDFTNPVEYTVTSEDNNTKTYKVEVKYAAPAKGKDILSFKIGSVKGKIDGENITVVVPSNTDLSNIKPSIKISQYAKISPKSGQKVDFSKGSISYIVTAQDGSTKMYLVTVKPDGEDIIGPDEEYINQLKTIRNNIINRYKKEASDDWDWMNIGFYEGLENGYKDGIRKGSLDLPKDFDLYKEICELNTNKLTDQCRATIMLTAMGIDASNLGKFKIDSKPFKTSNNIEVTDLTEQIYNFSGGTTVNDFIFSLIALDTGNYSVPNNAKYTRERLLEIVLEHEYGTDGFGIDMVAMLMQSIFPYRNHSVYGERVRNKLDEGLDIILGYKKALKVNPMNENFMFDAWGAINSESSDQVIGALCCMGIDPYSDMRFSRGEKDNLIYNWITKFVTSTKDGFGHANNNYNHMATYQGAYALQWYINFLENGSKPYSLYYDVPFDFSKNFNDNAEISSFSILDKQGIINNDEGTITIDLPEKTTEKELEDVVPIIEISEKATITPRIGEPQNFNQLIQYVVTAEDGVTKNVYNIIINKSEDVKSSKKSITSFTIKEIEKSHININEQRKEISLVLPSDTDPSQLSRLTPVIVYTGKNINPLSQVPQDFSKEVIYTVIAEDETTVDYKVNVSIKEKDDYEFTKFILRGVEGDINKVHNEININLPFGTYVEKIKPNEVDYEPYKVTTSIAPSPTIASSFKDTNIYRIMPYPADKIIEYKVNINYVESGGDSNITSFSIGNYTGEINTNSILIKIPSNKSEEEVREELKDEVPTIEWSGKSIDPMPNREINSLDDYLCDYILTDENDKPKIYSIKFVKDDDLDTKDDNLDTKDETIEITSFSVEGIKGIIDQENSKIFLEIPYEMDPYMVFPLVSITKGADIYPSLGQPINLRKNIMYTLSKGKQRRHYIIIVRRAKPKPATKMWRYIEQEEYIPIYQISN